MNHQSSKAPSTSATYLAKGDKGASFNSQTTALLLIDPVNDFLSEGGAAYEETKATLKLHDVVGNIRKVMDAARGNGMLVLFGPMAYTEEDYADEQLQRRSGINRFMFEKKMFLAGSWGADFHPELQPQQGDIVLLPHKSCDVFLTDLPEHLEKRGITHLVIVGMTANLCCESTARHAMEAGYDVTLISDAIGAAGVPAYEAAVMINFPLIANAVIKTEDFLSAMKEASAGKTLVQEGDTVYGSDRGELGSVKEVVQATADTVGYMLVPQGMIFKTDTYIPLDAVVQRIGTDVFINIPKMVVAAMPWGNQPTQSDIREKQGPAAASVDKLYGSRSASVQE